MDDDNDFQSQKFHLAGEESSRSPQTLQSFTFPKFDIDDHLQVHLRFDSLAETEVFDIQSQESNWIEEFSSRSSAIGFNSAAVEPCSIHRHINVWSEASSSESVEMLLNSVREDEMINQHSIKEEVETHAMDDCTNKTVDTLDTGPVSPNKSAKVVESNEDAIVTNLDNVGTSDTFTGEKEEKGIDEALVDDKLQLTEEVASDILIIDGNLQSSLRIDVKESAGVDESFQEADKSLNFESMNDKAPDDLACDAKTHINEVYSGSLTGLIAKDGPQGSLASEVKGNSNSLTDMITKEVAVSEKPNVPLEYKENLAGQFRTVDNVEGDSVNEHGNSSKVLKNTSLETCRDSLPLLDKESSSVVFPQVSDGLLESIAYPTTVFKMEKQSGEEILTCTEELCSAAVLCDADPDRKTIDSVEGSSVQLCERERSTFSSERHLGDDNQHGTMQINNFEKVNLGEEKAQTPLTTPADKEELKIVSSDVNYDKLASSGCTQSTEANDVTDFDTCPQDSRLKSSILQKNGDDCTEDITKISAESEGEHNCLKPSARSDDVENITSICEKRIDTVISSTDVSMATEVEGKLSTPIEDYTKETVGPRNEEPCAAVSIAIPIIDKVDTLNEPNRGKLGGTCSSSPPNSKLLQVYSDEVLQTDIGQKEVAVSSPIAIIGENEKDGSFSLSSGANSILDSNTSNQPLDVPDAALAGSPPKIFPKGSGETFSSFADTSTQCNLQINEVNSSLDHESSRPETPEQTCDSPTIICSNENSVKNDCQMGSRSLIDPPLPASETVIIGKKENIKDTKEMRTSEDDGGFTFEVRTVADISPKDSGSNWKPFSKLLLDEQSQISIEKQNESKDGSKQTDIVSNVEEDKRTQASGQASRKGGIARGDGKEKVQQKRSRGKERTPSSTSTPSEKSTRRKSRTEDVKQYPFVECSNTKSPLTPTIQTSNLPDLNSSISTTVLLQQPFTDLQQIQLRAQIFVYGSLIQGLPPDEACMVSAFGGTDGGKNLWESSWRAALDRFQKQKSPLYHADTPLHSRLAVSAAEQGSSSSVLQTKPMSTTGWSGSKVVSSAAVSSPVAYTSPLWSVPSHDVLPSNIPRGTQLEFNQAASPMHQYPSSAIRQYANTSSPWLSQSPRPSSWVFSGSTPHTNVQYSPIPASEAVKVTPSSSASRPLSMQVALAPTSLLSQSVPGVPAISVATVETPIGKVNTKIESASLKSRKKKKITAPEEVGLALSTSKPVVEPVPVAAVTKKTPTSTGFPVSVNSPDTVTSLTTSMPLTVAPSYFQMVGVSDIRQRAIAFEEACSHSEQSKLQAENASVYAASAVKHCQGIWDQLLNRQKSGLSSDAKDKLVSAAAAAAAATSVAKAAAEAAKVASEAALQAKMMADEALNSIATGGSNLNTEFGLDSGGNMAKSTSTAVGKGKNSDKTQGTSSIISAAREAARKRIETTSATTKRAENLDAVVKAAELAAEAISHAGTIISMGDPLPFSVLELVEAGPEGYWKRYSQPLGTAAGKTDARIDEILSLDVDGDHDGSANRYSGHPLSHQKREVLTDAGGMTSKDELTIHSDERNDGNGTGNTSKVGGSIKKGSLVEVAANKEGLRGVWFSAWVLDVKEGKAYVCYKDRLDEGHGQIKEWVPLDCKSETAPRIRNAHPSTLARSEGTRKRRRDAVVNYVWAVGDKVDAWLDERWCEGVVTEKCEGDETKLTVHFPAGGDSSIVRAWNLRPSLVWRDGQWVEWSRCREELYKGDTPNEKRQKHGRLQNRSSTEMGDKSSYAEDSEKPKDSRQLNLSDKDIIFSLGKNTVDENLINQNKVKRIGLQKEGSRVVFGIPKPGKKRKFMEVSKHYTADKSQKALEGSESMKFTQYLMPQSSNLQRNISKADGKGKRTFDSKAKGLKSLRSQSNQARSTSEKDTSESSRGSSQNQRNFFSEDRTLDKSSLIHGTHVPEKSEFAVIESSVRPVPPVQLYKNKNSASVEAETVDKGNASSLVDKSSRSDVSENLIKASADVNEPRRSNRRIQPTSRLLEGLQSSLIISKIPSVSHDKGNRSSHRGAASSRGHSRG